MANKLQVTELDFDDIKSNLKTFLKNQTEFSDYNFEGSGLSVLVDLLAYNTHYLGMNANLALNEAFLDTASLRSSVVSHAKTLGYTPSSARAPVAYLDITVNNPTLTSLTMDKGTKFTTSVDDVSYAYVSNEDYTVTPVNGILRFSNIPVYEGTLITAKYTVDSANIEKRYLLNSDRADTTTLKVSVQNSSSDATTEVYSLATDVTQVTGTAKVYFLQEVEDGKFEVYFGDDVVGKKLADGNIVILEYVVTNKEESNGADTFSVNSVGGETDVTVATLIASSGGAEPESIASIKFNAPLDYSSQGRAVTTKDYETIVPKVYADTSSVQVYGGEDADPPKFGEVFISIKTNSGATLTEAQKQIIVNSLDRYNIASVRPTILNPETTYLRLTTTFKYNSNATTKTASDLETIVRSTLTSYNTSTLQKFDGVFRYSKLTALIDNSDSSILSNITNLRISKNLIPSLSVAENYTVKFSNPLFHPHSGHISILSSTGFTISGNSNTLYLDDDGNGNVRTYYIVGGTTNTYVDELAGTINYTTGEIVLTSINITSTVNSDNSIDLVVKPSSNDVVPVRNQLLEIDFANTSIAGQNDTIESGGSSAGTGYVTSSSN